MAGKETKTITIYNPSKQQSTISEQASFGWVLESAYDLIQKETPRYPGHHHVELHFERDPSIPHYAELKALDEEYSNTYTVFPNEPRFGCLFAILGGFLGILMYLATNQSGIVLILVALIVPGVVISIIRKAKYKREYAEAEEAKVSTDAKRSEILKKAQAVIDGKSGNLSINSNNEEKTEKETVNNNTGKIKLIVEREDNVIYSAMPFEICIDKKKAFSIENASKGVDYLDNGSHSIYASLDYNTQSEVVNFNADNSEIKFKLSVLGVGKIKLEKIVS
jgi:hypothetical protein